MRDLHRARARPGGTGTDPALAARGRAIDPVLILAVAAGAFAGLLYTRLRKPPKPYRITADLEYWVFVPKAELPPQDQVMESLIAAPALEPAHHLLLSDVRLHVGLATREKNALSFRPDVLGEGAETLMDRLADCQGFFRVRFLADKLGAERRHLVYLPYLAYAYGRLGGALVVADRAMGRAYSFEDFGTYLKDRKRPDRFADHVAVDWIPEEEGGHAQTRGMGKLGLPELLSPRVAKDEERIVTALLEEYAERLWRDGAVPDSREFEMFEDGFLVEPHGPQKRGVVSVRMRRTQTN